MCAKPAGGRLAGASLFGLALAALVFGCESDDDSGVVAGASCTELENATEVTACSGSLMLACGEAGADYAWELAEDCADDGKACRSGACVSQSSGGGACDPLPERWNTDCSTDDECGPAMYCGKSCPSCDRWCRRGCGADEDCEVAGAGTCRARTCSNCFRTCSEAPTMCPPEGYGEDEDDEPVDDTPPPPDPPEEEEPECSVDRDCRGVHVCDEGICERPARIECVPDCVNQACAGRYEFCSEKYGACEAVSCRSDADCARLVDCDDPDAGSSPRFQCNVNRCVRANF